MENLRIPIAAVFPYPSQKLILILDYYNMYYEVEGDTAIQLSGQSGLKIDLRNARYGTLASRWPTLTELPNAGYFEAIIHAGVPFFCINNEDSVTKWSFFTMIELIQLFYSDPFLEIQRQVLQPRIV